MRTILTLSLFLSALYSDLAAAACVTVPKATKDAPVKACETVSHYTFDIAGNSFSYDKTSYRQGLANLLRSWLDDRDIAWSSQPAAVEFWLAVPEANPHATQARAVVRMGGERFILFMSVHPQDWQPENITVSVLERGDTYPQSYGYRAGTILVKKQAAASDDELHELMDQHGAYAPRAVAPDWFDYEVDAFQETEVTASIMGSDEAQPYVARADLNYTLEWIALREKAFTFYLSSP